MREDDRTGVSETRPDRQYRMPPCPIHSQFRVVGHDLGGRTHRTCPLSDFEPRSTWLKGATWEIPAKCEPGERLTNDLAVGPHMKTCAKSKEQCHGYAR